MIASGPERRFEPAEGGAATAPFWDGTRRQQLMLQWCRACDAPVWFPREVCPGCLGDDLDWRQASGEGEVHAISWQHVQDDPYAVALVMLDEGVRMMTNVVGSEPGAVPVGTRVRVTWEALSDGRHLPLFERLAAVRETGGVADGT